MTPEQEAAVTRATQAADDLRHEHGRDLHPPCPTMYLIDGYRTVLAALAEAERVLDGGVGVAAELAARVLRLEAALEGLLEVISNDDLVPESVSYMREARAALAGKTP